MKLAVALTLVALAALGAFTVVPGRAQTGLPASGGPALYATAAGQEAEDDGPDILRMALITAGAVGGGAALATVLYLVRRAIGFDLHRPPEGDEGGGEH